MKLQNLSTKTTFPAVLLSPLFLCDLDTGHLTVSSFFFVITFTDLLVSLGFYRLVMEWPYSSVTLPAFLALLFSRISSASPTCASRAVAYGNYSTTRYSRESINIRCVDSSYDKINWFFNSSNANDLETYPFSWCSQQRCSLCNTTLHIKRVGLRADGEFTCIASSSATGRNITATFILRVDECAPSVPEVLTAQNVTASLTHTATLTCKANMGHCYQHESTYLWLFSNNSLIEDSKKYTISDKLVADILETTLVVHDVTEMDMVSYICILIDDHFVTGNKKVTVFLSATEIKNEDSSLILEVVLPLVVVVIIIILVVGLVVWFCRERIMYSFLKGRKRTRGLKTYDVIIYKDDDHRYEAEELGKQLESLMYKVCFPEDGSGGTKYGSLEELIECSASVIFLCNDNDGDMTMILNKAQENLSVFVIQTEENHSNPSGQLYMAGFVSLRWPSDQSSSIVCKRLLLNLRRNEFYFKLRKGLPKPKTDNSSLKILNETNPHNDMDLRKNDRTFI